jgi:hypothetical protein
MASPPSRHSPVIAVFCPRNGLRGAAPHTFRGHMSLSLTEALSDLFPINVNTNNPQDPKVAVGKAISGWCPRNYGTSSRCLERVYVVSSLDVRYL